LGGISGDVLGAANELGRVVGVHAGVVAWTLL
jgi:adenosylcobinamide-GDP ribazoletransferase